MAERIAKVHRNQSNRAKPQHTSDRKVVFKSVLDNPFRIQWPNVPLNIQNSFLAFVVSLLDGVADYQQKCQQIKRKRKREQNAEIQRKKPNTEQKVHNVSTALLEQSSADDRMEVEQAQDSPAVLDHISVGINEVTKDLEKLAKLSRETVPNEEHQASIPDDEPARLVFVCREDVNPSVLVEHIPQLVAACNSARHRLNGAPSVWLVPLAKGSEASLAAAVGLRRAAVMTVKSTAPDFSKFSSLLESTPLLSAPWLGRSTAAQPRAQSLVPTHIKQLRTTAPKDMKAAKEKRSKGRALAKERRRAKSGSESTKLPKRVMVTS